ncbi:MAG: hypothetical protein JWM53_6359, partial [bacterium]|nr:hypothetical protein [bacterium]
MVVVVLMLLVVTVLVVLAVIGAVGLWGGSTDVVLGPPPLALMATAVVLGAA